MAEKFYPYWGAKHPEAYEMLNTITDPDQRIEAAMHALAGGLAGKTLLDVGAGSGFHAVRYAQTASHVFALEPDPLQRQQMHARLSRSGALPVSVLAAGAETIPLPAASVDVAVARFAYFFGAPDCLPGMAQVKRTLRPGGAFFIIDTDPDHSDFGGLARRAYPHVFVPEYTARADAFYASHGFTPRRVDACLRAPDRATLATVIQHDFPNDWETFLEDFPGNELSFTVRLYLFTR